MPEIGETRRIRNKQGQAILQKWVVCPDCGEGRWVAKYSVARKCQKCYIAKAKKEGWAGRGY